jgi:ferredoxin-NADP reductase
MGKGFPVDRAPAAAFPTLLLFATGSGISPIKALIESGALDAGKRADVRLYYGVRNEAAMAYAELTAGWEREHGVKVVPVFSEAGKGYVQDAFAAAGGAPAGGGGVAAVLCGQKGMAEAVTAMLTGAGMPKELVLTNF